MLLILEIVLTISAWRKGWKAWALLPVLCTAFLGFMVGLSMSTSGQSSDTGVLAFTLPIDLLCICVLGFMTAKGRNKVKENVPEYATDTTDEHTVPEPLHIAMNEIPSRSS